ncbi:DnaJ like protein subfamily C member 19 [Trypanosoma conorhini]|uniref:DnaJ like protein subfamily C member 19 n=1 Tax=Trypanosoma conorhini TaxID=83891 RepID=A0A422PVP0_9TRYP|nr:DnaJ like protein subfamily C member 19 [Trypanosoma conorhini]RNF21811.1 DnaJ like protein subfamily C member 19 [Trypanosoma conorhini]
MAAPLTAMLLLAGAYYVTRLAPRVSQRVAMAQGGMGATQALHAHQSYRRHESGFAATMSEREALLLLGFPEDVADGTRARPSDQQVKERYYALMKHLHSDVSGSPYIATKLNEARDVLSRR